MSLHFLFFKKEETTPRCRPDEEKIDEGIWEYVWNKEQLHAFIINQRLFTESVCVYVQSEAGENIWNRKSTVFQMTQQNDCDSDFILSPVFSGDFQL